MATAPSTVLRSLRRTQPTVSFVSRSTQSRTLSTLRSSMRTPFQRFAFQARQNIQFHLRKAFQRRAQSTAADAGTVEQSTFNKLWNSHVGPKTVHFWAPVMKWILALTGASDFYRPPEQLSLSQNAALMFTGLIWTRWCFVIRPQNYLLAAVNFFLFCVGATQVTRIYNYNRSVHGGSLQEDAEKLKEAAKDKAKAIQEDPKAVIKGQK